MNEVVIIDYQMGNVASVAKAFKKCGARTFISRDPQKIASASHLVLPGVGAFGKGMENLKKLGLVTILKENVLKHKKPFLGICLGMQLLAKKGFEFGEHEGLGWIEGEVLAIRTKNLRLPHIGWDNIEILDNRNILKDIPDDNFYFDHSFYLSCSDKKIITSFCRYGEKLPASIKKNNIYAVQFHPEKSQVSGLKLIANFLAYA